MKMKVNIFRIKLCLAGAYVKLRLLCRDFFCRSINKRPVRRIYLYYRICDHGYDKVKASYITKEKCLANAIDRFPLSKVEWKVFADNVSEDTYAMILKYVPASRVERVSVGHGAGTFRMAYEEAVVQDDDTLVYFLEDDYLHCSGSLQRLVAVAQSGISDYFTLYDHPDKYQGKSPNPYVVNGGEKSKVYFAGNHHWKTTDSTTMTFAAFADTLRRDKKYFWRWTVTSHPYDFYIFLELKKLAKRTLVSPIPSLSTHGDSDFLALGIDWEKQTIPQYE